MKITFKGDYALKIILDLSILYGKKTSIKDLSQRQDMPRKFLEQIVTTLKGAGYIKTERGKNGGITLAKDPAKITMGEIIRLIEGPTSPITCVSKSCHTACGFEPVCALKAVFAEVRDRTNEIVDNTTFKDLTDKANSLKKKTIADYVI